MIFIIIIKKLIKVYNNSLINYLMIDYKIINLTFILWFLILCKHILFFKKISKNFYNLLSFYNLFLCNNNNNNIKKSLNFFFFTYYLNKYFNNKLKKNTLLYFYNVNYNLIETNKYYNWLIDNIKKNNINTKFFYKDFIYLLIKTIISFFVTKDTYFLSLWIKKFFEKIYFKNHKKLLIMIKYIFFFFYKYLCIYLKVKGYRFLIKGKISLGGNSKKKKFEFKSGFYSLNKKILNFNFNKNYINTISGVLGFYIFIFF